MHVSVLGKLEVTDRGLLVPVTRARERAVLAALALRSPQLSPPATVSEALWGGGRDNGHKAIQTYILRLRSRLGHESVETVSGAYRLSPAVRIDVADLDATVDALAESSLTDQSAGLRALLERWRGRPYDDLDEWPPAVTERRRLAGVRDEILDRVLECDLVLGRSVLPELESLVGEQPTRERRCALLMVALYRAGRQREALTAFETTRRCLLDEAGLTPSAVLTHTYHRILDHDPSLRAVELHLDEAPRRSPAASLPLSGSEVRTRARAHLAEHRPDLAIRLLRDALDESSDTETDASIRAELLIDLGAALRQAGEPRTANEAFVEAGELARSIGDAKLLATAALAASGHGYLTTLDATSIPARLLDDAARQLSPSPSPLRARVLARHAVVMEHSEPADVGRKRAEQALAMARILEDAEALAVALEACLAVDHDPGAVSSRVALITELDDLGVAHDRWQWQVSAGLARARDLAICNDLDAAIAILERIGLDPRSALDPAIQYAAAHRDVLDATHWRDWDAARAAADKVLQASLRALPDPNAGKIAYWGMTHTIAALEGCPDVEALRPLADAFTLQTTMDLTLRAAISAAFAAVGDTIAAQAELDRLDSDAIRACDRDLYWLPALANLAHAASTTRDTRIARLVIELAAPFSDFAIVDGGFIYYGTVADSLARVDDVAQAS